MAAVLGGRAIVGKNCHIGAGTVLAGVVEPASAVPVVIEDDVVIGANAVVLEGCRVGKGAVVAAGAVVVSDVAPGAVVAGVPAKVLKAKDGKTADKTALADALREKRLLRGSAAVGRWSGLGPPQGGPATWVPPPAPAGQAGFSGESREERAPGGVAPWTPFFYDPRASTRSFWGWVPHCSGGWAITGPIYVP